MHQLHIYKNGQIFPSIVRTVESGNTKIVLILTVLVRSSTKFIGEMLVTTVNVGVGTRRSVGLVITTSRLITSGTIFPITVPVAENGKRSRVPIVNVEVKFVTKSFGITNLSIVLVRGGTRSNVRIHTAMAA